MSTNHSTAKQLAADNAEFVAPAKAIIEAATSADGFEPISEQFRRHLQHNTMLTMVEAGKLVGFATLDGATCELVVHPEHRGKGYGAQLLAQVPAEVPVWAHGNLPAAKRLAEKTHRLIVRELLVMQIAGRPLERAAEVELPQGAQVASLGEAQREAESGALPSEAELRKAWLEANNQAFDWHPEQGGWDMAKLEEAMDTDWFDPHDVLFLLDASGQMQGFHWVKQLAGKPGEVYVVGLADHGRGKGLGQPLIATGLKRLVDCGNTEVILYVEADNASAVKAYERLGFEVVERHVLYGPAA